MIVSDPDLTTRIGLLNLKNPVIAASGTFGYGEEFSQLIDVNALGGIVVKGLSLKPRAGNPPPRIVETPCGMLNAIGLANIGLDCFLDEKLPRLRRLTTHVIVNIYGHSLEEYGTLAKGLSGVPGVAALEVNISCPNVEQGGMAFGVDPRTSAEVTKRVKENTDKPVIVKLSPNVTDIRDVARAVEDAGADAVSLINTLTGMSVDVERRRARLGNVVGGLSGPAIRPVAVYMVYRVAACVSVPVIGIGGIVTAADALEFIMAGACAVQVGTAGFARPSATVDVIEGLARFCSERKVARLSDLIGCIGTDG
jgi:dihydroorotate dehydrogenase (NAD+) catalytic subunit